jgi:glycosyltransferase involved in cell wall biosynthesis
MSKAPLVSCVLATRDRARFLPQAMRCFLRQTYERRELIVVDDSRRPMRALIPEAAGIRYLRLTRPTATGTKLNLGIAEARGELIQKMDDDDYYAPGFVAGSVADMPRRGRDRTVVTRCCFLVLGRRDARLRFSGHGWKPGGALCFARALWERQPFRDVEKSEDSHWLRDVEPRVVRICDPEQYVVLRHGRNTWKAIRAGGEVRAVDDYFAEREVYGRGLEEVVGAEDAQFYGEMFGW